MMMSEAAKVCMALQRQGHETLPPSALRVLAVAMDLGQPLNLRRLATRLGCSTKNAEEVVKRLTAAGLIRRGEKWESGLAVACVFIPGERR